MSSEKKEAPATGLTIEEAAETAHASSVRSGMSRRALCLGVGSGAVMLGLGALNLAPHRALVRPPGGQDEGSLLARCLRCERCVEACPRGVIRPQHLEDGIVGVRTPVLYFERDYCSACVEENDGVPLCVEACPTGALQLDASVEAKSVVVGKAVLYEGQCLAYRMAGCRFCYDACPYDAMELDDMGRPLVVSEKCNGCGACESVCVSQQQGSVREGSTHRAIVVEAVAGWGEAL